MVWNLFSQKNVDILKMTLSPGDDEPEMMMGDVMWYHYTVSTHLFVPTQDHEASLIVHQGREVPL